MTETSYTAKDITVLEGLEPVRLATRACTSARRAPAGLHHLVYEVVDNSVDEALAGRNERIEITLHPDESVTVRDFGSGIPVDIMADQGRPALEVVLTKLHAGAKVRRRRLQGLRRPPRRRRVGRERAVRERSSPRCAATGRSTARSSSRGAPVGDMEIVGDAEPDDTGTQIISFTPTRRSSRRLELSAQTLTQRFRETAFLTQAACGSSSRTRARRRRRQEFYAEGGIRDFVSYVNEAKDTVHKHVVYLERATDDGSVEVAMQWNTSYVESVFSFANNINTHEGGTHLSGFKAALTGTLNKYAREKGLLKEKEENLEGEDVREGLAAVISVKLREPQFEGQTKTKLGNPWVRGLVEQTVNAKLAEFMEENPNDAQPDHPEGGRRAKRAPGGTQGARADAAKERPRRRLAPREAGRLPDARPGGGRGVPGRGQLGRRLGDRRARPAVPGDPPAPRQGDQLGEEPDREGALERRDPGDHHGDRDGDRGRVRPRAAPLPPRDHHDRRRCGRIPHPHAHPHVPLPQHAASSSTTATCTSPCRRSTA